MKNRINFVLKSFALLSFGICFSGCSGPSPQRTLVFKNYDDFYSFILSDYNTQNNAFYVFDTSKSIEGNRLFYVEGIDQCYRYKDECLKDEPYEHYVFPFAHGVYETCTIPFDFGSVDTHHRSLYYILSFRFFADDLSKENIEWIESKYQTYSYVVNPYMYEQRLRYDLVDGGNHLLLHFEIHNIDNEYSPDYNEELVNRELETFAKIMDEIKCLYVTNLLSLSD